MNWLRNKLAAWLCAEHEARIKDLERHFVTKRDETGKVVETLADVPVHQRKQQLGKPAGMSWAQHKAWLEATDGGRKVEKRG